MTLRHAPVLAYPLALFALALALGVAAFGFGPAEAASSPRPKASPYGSAAVAPPTPTIAPAACPAASASAADVLTKPHLPACAPCKDRHPGSFVWLVDPSISASPVGSLVLTIDPATCDATVITNDPAVPGATLQRAVPLGSIPNPIATPSPAWIWMDS